MNKPPKFTISKVDAARRQLEVAVRLYFRDGDAVSVHTLTAAAYNILRDLSKAHGKKPMIVKDNFIELTKPGKEKFVRDKLNEAENFFKHADKDPNGSLEFSPVETEILLFDACSQYQTLTGETFQVFKLYELWFLLHNIDVFNLPPQADSLIRTLGPEMVSMPKVQFFHTLLPLWFANQA